MRSPRLRRSRMSEHAVAADQARRELAALSVVNAPSVRAIVRRYSRQLRGAAPAMVLDFAQALLRDATWAERVIAWEVLAANADAFRMINDRLVEQMARGLSDWPSVDLYGVTVVGRAWREGLIADETILGWTRSPDRWRRRLALVATVPLNLRSRGGTGDAKKTLRVCRALLDDRDDMVVKALSWSLRELAKHDPVPVTSFLAVEQTRLAARVKREVGNKLTTGVKTPSRAAARRR
jgi:3-methyladenine DNA glycosylase AlkD